MPAIAGSDVVVPKLMSEAARRALADALFEVHAEIFDGVDREAFVKYVIESKAERTKIQLHKGERGEIVGYFALHFFERTRGGEPVTIVRGESGTLRAYRGQRSTMSWGAREVVDYAINNPRRTMYGLGCLVHPSSYLIAARYFDPAWPMPGEPVPPDLLALMLDLADDFHLAEVDPSRPLVRHVGWRTRDTAAERAYWQQSDKPAVRYFLANNPGYGEGHGLLTMAALRPSAIAGAIAKVARAKLGVAIEGAARRLPIASRFLRAGAARRHLREVPSFAGLDDAIVDTLARGAEVVSRPAGSVVLREGDGEDDVLVVARGAVYVVAAGSDDPIAQLGPGSIFGERAMLAGARRSASIRTAIPTTLVRVPGAAVRAAMRGDAAVREAISTACAARAFDAQPRG